jgi:hypothetical protein
MPVGGVACRPAVTVALTVPDGGFSVAANGGVIAALRSSAKAAVASTSIVHELPSG